MKKLFGTMAFAAALFAGYSAYEAQNSVNLNDVALANVEALAEVESDESTYCTGFYYVCRSQYDSFMAELERNCDHHNITIKKEDC